MATGISWTDETWNPVVGCTRVSAGCDHCYAVKMTHRLGAMAQSKREQGQNPGKLARYEGLTVLNNRGVRHFNGTVRCVEEALTVPMHWRKPRMVFVNSMSDLFHRDVPFDFIDRVFAVMALCPQHRFQVLTKRPERMAEYYERNRAEGWVSVAKEILAIDPDYQSAGCYNGPLPNVWLGTSIEDQGTADERVTHMQRCPAAVWFLSCEPLLSEVTLPIVVGCRLCNHPGPQVLSRDGCPSCGGSGQEPNCIDWVIVGGESGHGARPCDVKWIRQIVAHCGAAGVPCFVKQLGSNPVVDGHRRIKLKHSKGGDPSEWPEDLRVQEMPKSGIEDRYRRNDDAGTRG